MENVLLEFIQKCFPNDTVDDILDWEDIALKFKRPVDAVEYSNWRMYNKQGLTFSPYITKG